MGIKVFLSEPIVNNSNSKIGVIENTTLFGCWDSSNTALTDKKILLKSCCVLLPSFCLAAALLVIGFLGLNNHLLLPQAVSYTFIFIGSFLSLINLIGYIKRFWNKEFVLSETVVSSSPIHIDRQTLTLLPCLAFKKVSSKNPTLNYI